MRIFFISLMIALISGTAYAFEPYTAYCQVMANEKGYYEITFDSQTKQLLSTEKKDYTLRLADENGNRIGSGCAVDIINYLAKQGWKVSGFSTWSKGVESGIKYIYLMEKPVESEADLCKGISLRR